MSGISDHFFVLYDAGETNALLPVMEKFVLQGRNFKVLVMGTAETIIKPDMFPQQRIVLRDLSISTVVDNTNWQREQKLDFADVQKVCSQIAAKVIVTGAASRVQRQILKNFEGKRVTYFDNLDYDLSNPSSKTLIKTYKHTQIAFCPSKNLKQLLSTLPSSDTQKKLKIVGKPTLEQWAQELEKVDKIAVIEKLKFDINHGPIVTIIGGYGQGYDIINPLFDEAAQVLKENGFQVLIQPHPKVASQQVKTIEALAISDFVIGYNSTVIFEAAVVGKKGIFFCPETLSFDHFSIRENYLPQVSSIAQLLSTMQNSPSQSAVDLYEAEQIPKNSTERITHIMNKRADRV